MSNGYCAFCDSVARDGYNCRCGRQSSPKPTPPATPAELPAEVWALVEYVLAGDNSDDLRLQRCEKYAKAISDRYAKGGR